MALPNTTVQANVQAPVAPTQAVTDQYDLDDTDYDPEFELQEQPRPSSSSQPAAAHPTPSPAPLPSDRPRNPDGTFAPAKTAHSPRLTRMASDMGMSQAEIDELSPDALEAVVEQEYRRNRAEAQAQRRQSDVLDAASKRVGGKPDAATPETQPEPAEVDLGIDESQYDPGIVGILKAQAKTIQELKTRLDAVQGHQQAREAESTTQRADRAFAKHEAILGKGKFHELTPDSPEMLRRQAVANFVRADTSKLSLEQKIDRAADILFGSKPGSATPAAPAPAATETPARTPITREQWDEAGVARPTQRNGAAEAKGPKRAKQAVAAILREQRDSGDYGDEEQGLPD